MIFGETTIKDAFIVEIERLEDERGFFARGWCAKEFEANGIKCDFVQANIAFTNRKGTLRGLHYQIAPHQEAKLIRCSNGAIYDVIVDLRHDSSTYRKWFGVELTAENHKMLYVPEGCAHGYQTFVDNTELFYAATQFYAHEYERGIRWDDPMFGIRWPKTGIRIISDKDKNWPNYLR
jgi:dTDP-4-dehydrorhamnose 3,5-epimerase